MSAVSPANAPEVPRPEAFTPDPPLPTPEERLAEGRALRDRVPRSAHADWKPAAGRPDPLALLDESNQGRLEHLVPVRYGRMLANPFTFLRGSPSVMANDLAGTPTTGIRVQVCGDAHLMNFGVYASPERNLLFDINDFDETLTGPWEWDVKRLATSCLVAGRAIGLDRKECTEAARACVRSYRKRMRGYAGMQMMEVWYSRVDAQAVLEVSRRSARDGLAKDLAKARRRNSLQALSKLTVEVDGRFRIRDDPPFVCHIDDPNSERHLRRLTREYRATLQDDRRHLLERYRLVDFAWKVVGVGSVGTRCMIALFDSSKSGDPLFLQVKEARASILEPHLKPSAYDNHGRRVVNGQRLMQSASDIFLGWGRLEGHDYYVRQLRDMKGTVTLDGMTGPDLVNYAGLCGWALARAHARSGDAARIAGYLGKKGAFDEAVTECATALADQNERDYQAFRAAVRAGRIAAQPDIK